jgi:hypothetical protein
MTAASSTNVSDSFRVNRKEEYFTTTVNVDIDRCAHALGTAQAAAVSHLGIRKLCVVIFVRKIMCSSPSMAIKGLYILKL